MDIKKDFADQNGNYDIMSEFVADKKLRRIIDIGAWWGPWTLHWQPRANTVEIFEPNKKIIPMLEHNISSFNNCTLHSKALGDKKGTVSMSYATHSGTNHITGTQGDIEITTLDSYNFSEVDMVKIDVEGFEISVLKGAVRTITEQKPLLQIEMNKAGQRYGIHKKQVADLLQSWEMTRLAKIWPDQVWAFK